MSVREQLFVRTRQSPTDLADQIARLIGGRVQAGDDRATLLVDTNRLVPGAAGEFGGPVLVRTSDGAGRPDEEFEAPDAYNVEIRLWQAKGPRIDADTGTDVEAAAASAIFEALAHAGEVAVIHVRDDDTLVGAALPGKGLRHFPPDTTIYDWDERKWEGYVVSPDRRD